MNKVRCHRCNGTGEVIFKHVANGVCFACNGTGKLEYKAESTENNLMFFISNTRPEISGVRCKMIKSTSLNGSGVDAGKEYVAKKVGENVIFWNKKAGANWCFIVPYFAFDLMKKHFVRI